MKIIGQKINLRQLKKSDAYSIYHNIKDREIHRYLLVPYPYKLQQAKDFILKTHRDLRSGKAHHFGIEDKNSRQIIGMISIMRILPEHQRGEIGYWLGKKYHRQGLMSEALDLVLDFAFRKLKLQCVAAGVFDKNTASQNLLKKQGFKYRGRFQKFYFRYGRWYDDILFQLSREDYIKK